PFRADLPVDALTAVSDRDGRRGSETVTAGVDLGGTKIQVAVLRSRKGIGSARSRTPQTGEEGVVDGIVEERETGRGGVRVGRGRAGRREAGVDAPGEIEHTLVNDGGRLAGCGKRGHLEAYAGRKSIEMTARRRIEEGHHTILFDVMDKKGRDRVTSGEIAA